MIYDNNFAKEHQPAGPVLLVSVLVHLAEHFILFWRPHYVPEKEERLKQILTLDWLRLKCISLLNT